jgi:deoxycytidine triphosphate deaminase
LSFGECFGQEAMILSCWQIAAKRGTPIAQVVFKQLDHPTDQPYSGKYQHQKAGAQPAVMELV